MMEKDLSLAVQIVMNVLMLSKYVLLVLLEKSMLVEDVKIAVQLGMKILEVNALLSNLTAQIHSAIQNSVSKVSAVNAKMKMNSI